MFNLAELWGYRHDGSNPCRHVSKYPEKGSTRLISDEQMVSLFAFLDKAEAEELEHPIYLLAIRLQFEFAARMSEILLLQWDWLDLPNGRVVWPDSKTGDMSKPLSEEARRLLTNAPRYGKSPYVCPAILDHDKPLGPHPAPIPTIRHGGAFLLVPACRRSVPTASAIALRPTLPTRASRLRSAWR